MNTSMVLAISLLAIGLAAGPGTAARLDGTSPDCTNDQIDRARKAAGRGH